MFYDIHFLKAVKEIQHFKSENINSFSKQNRCNVLTLKSTLELVKIKRSKARTNTKIQTTISLQSLNSFHYSNILLTRIFHFFRNIFQESHFFDYLYTVSNIILLNIFFNCYQNVCIIELLISITVFFLHNNEKFAKVWEYRRKDR